MRASWFMAYRSMRHTIVSSHWPLLSPAFLASPSLRKIGMKNVVYVSKSLIPSTTVTKAYIKLPAQVLRMLRQEASGRVWKSIQSLGVDLPDHVMRKVTRRFDGMTPMERLIEEDASRIGQGQERSAVRHR
ncbi:hypothetical protein GP486_000111 [Trichoglossum hirsutum]|uniref:Uncharacterized protein n=1 Tax=Trichoglossum hirsutum TaxID=265104 RepID=A0A9P8RUA1_9PEZI|nr:hypothetical protein GP486_000111 [Trichoglossum hirsutum]